MNVLVVGYGSIGRRRAKIIRELGHEVAVVDEDSDQCLKALQDGFSPPTADLCHAFIVCTPPHCHIEPILSLFRGKPEGKDCPAIFIEKPLSHNRDGLDELQKVVDKTGTTVMVACNLRFEHANQSLASVSLGEPMSFHASFGYHLAKWRSGGYRDRYSAKADEGGGIVLEAIHEIDLAQWFMGRIVEVRAFVHRSGRLDADIEDLATIILRHESGTLSTLAVDCLQREYHRSVAIVGTEARRDFTYEPGEWMYKSEMQHFFDCIKNGELPMNGLAEARRTLEVALLAKNGGGKL